ncbi:putative unspecific monooxygenase [Rosa chinensis]|uniref:Putative unspecific monooxygenase n=1 Tax=Rosa chinensis TaxID=74649 RepID=A0A2P6SAS1_ROSCH|nr:alpha-humulene 10-hydroxylase [Rosa chinensis]PRQ55764.1 putative unspecific monooxygenase [Rosa chinensis]
MKPSTSSSSSSSPCGSNTLLTILFQSRSEACSNDSILRDLVAREFNAFLWISLIAVTALLLRKLFDLLRLWAKAKPIPGPPCPSFYGHSNLLSRQNITEVLGDLHKKYGSVVKLWLGPTRLLVSIKDPILIKEMLLKAADKLPMTGRAFHLAFGRSSLFASSFDEVQKRRETLLTELNGKVRENKNVFPTKAVDCVLERINNVMGKDSVDSRVFSQHMAFTMLGATLFGDAFLAWSKVAVYEELLMMIAKDAGFWASYCVTPFWKPGFWKYQSVCTKLKCLTQDIVQQCCNVYSWETGNLGKEVACGGPSCSEVRIVDNLFFEELNGHFNVSEEPYGNLMGIMFHGCLSTASLINNIMMNLATHPQIQDKIYSEVTMAQKDAMKEDQISADKLVLLLATIYESARLVSAGSLLQRCSLKHDFSLKSGHTIPAGAGLVVPVELVMMDDSTLGGDASEFNPYRFLSKAGEGSDIFLRKSFSGAAQKFVNLGESSFTLNDPNKSTAFLPFGSGIRACVGQKFVTEGVAMLFASLLKQYEIKLHPEAQDTSKPNNFGLQLLSSSHIVFVQRNS